MFQGLSRWFHRRFKRFQESSSAFLTERPKVLGYFNTISWDLRGVPGGIKGFQGVSGGFSKDIPWDPCGFKGVPGGLRGFKYVPAGFRAVIGRKKEFQGHFRGFRGFQCRYRGFQSRSREYQMI